MKVLHIGTLDLNAGGPAMSTYNTLKGLCTQGIDAELLMYPLSPNGRLRGEDVPVHFAKAPVDSKLLYSPVLKKEIRSLGEYAIYHAQGIWQYPTYALVDIAKQRRKPYLITPRGMLYPQDIRKSNERFKRLSLKFRLLKDLNQAACVHVTCEEEMQHCRDLGVMSPIAVVPNPIEPLSIKGTDYKSALASNVVSMPAVFRLGYLGRLSPRKNVEGLIYAWSALGECVKNAELLIIGGGDVEYTAFLKREVQRLQLSNVCFTGFLLGEEKDKAIASLSVLAMPSEFENFGNVILEGLIRAIPCIATKGAPWQELETHCCGWWVDYSQEAITDAVSKALKTSKEVLQEMGVQGKELVAKSYSVEAVAKQMKKLYLWVVGEGEQPEFVSIS